MAQLGNFVAKVQMRKIEMQLKRRRVKWVKTGLFYTYLINILFIKQKKTSFMKLPTPKYIKQLRKNYIAKKIVTEHTPEKTIKKNRV